MKPIIFMFSGQGTHYYQMGRALFAQNELFKTHLLKADKICQKLMSTSVIKHLYDTSNPISKPFDSTVLTHPAIFMVEYALSQVLIAKDIIPTMVLATSLGEFAASVIAGIMSFEDALVSVIKQAQILETHCSLGRMLAILGQPTDIFYHKPFLYQNSELAAINFGGSFVISSSEANINNIEQTLQEQRITSQKLAVSHAFHSSFIDQAENHFLDFINKQTIKAPVVPFISAAYTSHIHNITPNHFWHTIRLPIKFQATIKALEEKNNYYYLDVGPTGTLATFVKYNLVNRETTSKSFAVLTPFNQNITGQALDNLKNFLKNN